MKKIIIITVKVDNFSKNLKEAQIDEIKLRLNDGSRIVGNSSIRKGQYRYHQ